MRGKEDYSGMRKGVGGRGGYRGRGGNFGGRPNMGQHQNRHFKSNPKPFIPHVSFDFIQAEQSFPRVKTALPQEDKSFNDALVLRSQELTPGANEQTQLSNLLTKIQTIMDNLVLAPGDFDSCVSFNYISIKVKPI